MGVTSEILGNSGSPHQIEHAGRVYKFRLIDQAVQSDWEKRLYEKDCTGAKIQYEAGLVSPERYAQRLDELTTAFSDGEYDMMSTRSLKLLTTKQGALLLMSLVVPCSWPDLVHLLMAKQAETVNMIQLLIRESFPGVKIPTDAKSTEGSSPNA